MKTNVDIYCKRYQRDLKKGMKRFAEMPLKDGNLNEQIPFIAESVGSIKCIYNRNSFQQRMINELPERPLIYGEALIKTYPSKNLKRKVLETLKKNLLAWQIECEIDVDGKKQNLIEYYYDESDYDSTDLETRCAGNVQIVIPIKDPTLQGNEDLDSLKKDLDSKISWPMRFFGYDFSSCQFHVCQSDVYCNGKLASYVVLAVLQYEAKYHTDVVELNKFLYHITTKEKLDKILKNGLAPKSSSNQFKYSECVYLFNCDNINLMCQYAIESEKKTSEWILLQIDPKKIPNLKLYVDVAFVEDSGAVFTYNNIPPSAIVGSKSMTNMIEKFKQDNQIG